MSEPLVEEVSLSMDARTSLLEKFPYLRDVHYRLITSIKDLQLYMEGLRLKQPLALDLETTGLSHLTHHIVGVSLTYMEQEGVYLPIAHTVHPELNLSWAPVKEILEGYLKDKQRPVIVYNQKFEGNFLPAAGMDTSTFDWQDCMVSVYVSDPNECGRKLSLKRQTFVRLGIKQVEFEDMFPDVPKDKRDFANVDPNAAYLYACGDVDFTLRHWNSTAPGRKEMSFTYKLENPLTDVLRRMENNWTKLDIPYYEVVRQELSKRIQILEERIFRVTGRKTFKKRTRTMVKRNPETKQPLKGPNGKSIKEKVVDLIEVDFDLSSPAQVGQKLFRSVEEGGLGIENPHKTEKGKIATGEGVIEALAGEHAVIGDILLYRKLLKCRSTYLDHLIQDANDKGEGRFSFFQCAAPTGRMAGISGGPGSGMVDMNVQSTPKATPEEGPGWEITKWRGETPEGGYPCLNAFPTNYLNAGGTWYCSRKECQCIKEGKAEGCHQEKMKYWVIPNIRKGFVGHEGFYIVAIDYSGIELRIASNLSREPVWVNAFHSPDPDLHRDTALAVYKKKDISKQERGNAKTLNFLTLFGGSGKAAARQIKGMSEAQGDSLVESFFKALPVLDGWIKGMHAKGKKEHCVHTWFGRKRPLHMYSDPNPDTQKRSANFGDRSTVSTAVQGTAADVMKIALLRLDFAIRTRGWHDRVRMLLTVHDECVFEVRKDCIEEVVPVLVESMAFPVDKWVVPLICDVEIGNSWGDGKEYRLIDGKLILHSEMSKASKEDLTPPTEDRLPEWAEEELPESEEREENEGPETVTVQFMSLRTKKNLELFSQALEQSKRNDNGDATVIITFAGEAFRVGVEDNVDLAKLLQISQKNGISVKAIATSR